MHLDHPVHQQKQSRVHLNATRWNLIACSAVDANLVMSDSLRGRRLVHKGRCFALNYRHRRRAEGSGVRRCSCVLVGAGTFPRDRPGLVGGRRSTKGKEQTGERSRGDAWTPRTDGGGIDGNKGTSRRRRLGVWASRRFLVPFAPCAVPVLALTIHCRVFAIHAHRGKLSIPLSLSVSFCHPSDVFFHRGTHSSSCFLSLSHLSVSPHTLTVSWIARHTCAHTRHTCEACLAARARQVARAARRRRA